MTLSEKQLGLTIEFLREEDRILWSKLPERITVTKKERNRVVKLGSQLGSAINGIITIVTPRTFAVEICDSRMHRRRRVPRLTHAGDVARYHQRRKA